MKNLFLLFSPGASSHFVMALDLITELRNKGEEVFLLIDNPLFKLQYKASNPYALKAVDYMAKIRLMNILKKMNFPKQNIFFTGAGPSQFKKEFNAFYPTTVEELQTFAIDGIDIGMSVYGSIASHLRDISINVEKNIGFIRRAVNASITVYETVSKIVDRIHPDKIYLCNGRWADVRPAGRVAQRQGIKYYLYDYGASYKSYILLDFLFSIKEFQDKVKECWNVGCKNKENVGRSWFLEQRNGKTSGSLSIMFLDRQKDGVLPSGFDFAKRNIVIYNSSVDELAGFPEWRLKLYRNEVEGIEDIAQSCLRDKDIVLYVRIHPNLALRNSSQVKKLQQLAAKNIQNLRFIWPSDVVDSYALLEAAEKIIVFHSTVGVEATFWGKPSILLGSSAYEDLDCVYTPASESELMGLIYKNDLPPRDIVGALKYGYFYKATSSELKHFDNSLLFDDKAIAAMFKTHLSLFQRIVRGIYQRLDDYKLQKLAR